MCDKINQPREFLFRFALRGGVPPKEFAIGSVSQGNKLKSGARFCEPEGNGDSEDSPLLSDAILETEARTAGAGVSVGDGRGCFHVGTIAGISGTVKGFVASEMTFAKRTVAQTVEMTRAIVRSFCFIYRTI